MKKGQKLSKTTNLARYNHEVKLMKEQAKRERQRIRESCKASKSSNTSKRRSTSTSSNKYTYTPSSPTVVDKLLEGIWDFIFNVLEKISQKIFR
jgi:hypothetical protein